MKDDRAFRRVEAAFQPTNEDAAPPAHGRPKKPRTDWERYSVTPRAIYLSGLSLAAKVMYGFSDCVQGKDGDPLEGINETARLLGIPIATCRKARTELIDAGLWEETAHLNENGAESKRTLRLIHNPARNPQIINPDGVTLPANTRAGKPSTKYPGADPGLVEIGTGGGPNSDPGVVDISTKGEKPVVEIQTRSLGLVGIKKGTEVMAGVNGLSEGESQDDDADFKNVRVDDETGEIVDDDREPDVADHAAGHIVLAEARDALAAPPSPRDPTPRKPLLSGMAIASNPVALATAVLTFGWHELGLSHGQTITAAEIILGRPDWSITSLEDLTIDDLRTVEAELPDVTHLVADQMVTT